MLEVYQDGLFSSDFLMESIIRLPDWIEVSDAEIADFASKLVTVFSKFPIRQSLNEVQTIQFLYLGATADVIVFNKAHSSHQGSATDNSSEEKEPLFFYRCLILLRQEIVSSDV